MLAWKRQCLAWNVKTNGLKVAKEFYQRNLDWKINFIGEPCNKSSVLFHESLKHKNQG